ncbi:non-ribosomal peptide synthetase [Spirosoma rhododendri]|uniref:Amino acid adenylation domain-containing protein n=1 Tax=Spirosoma rhododendri TaxID=2728024 RepID=A0A7L5DP38_9BACT|nr:non-ribosomal peptide synthetase [Spirosoma rhododendri]QJD80156.1 amino acid adenylation domain-containing protein [Spirosoma rhododendri]
MTLSTPHAKIVDFDPFAGPAFSHIAPSTEAQMEIWAACLLGGDDASRAYNESISLQFTGFLDRYALEQALFTLITRHEALRSVLSPDGKTVCVYTDSPVRLQFRDVSAELPENQQRQLTDYTREESTYVFDLQHGPLLKATLFSLSASSHYFVMTAHHIICDGWSTGIMLQELGTLYSAYTQKMAAKLPDAIPFSQYARERFLFNQSDDYQQSERYWLDQYADNIPTVHLPTDFPRKTPRSFDSDRLDYPLKPDVVAAVKKMGLKAGCGFVTTLMTAFEVLLYRLTGQNDIVLGLPAADQSATGHYQLVGHCVSLLPLRSKLTADVSFLEFLKHRKTAVQDALDHRLITFGSLLKKLSMARDLSTIPLVPVVFNVDMGLDDGVHFHDLTFQLISNPRAYENFELFVNISGAGNALTVEWSYNTQLFTAETIRKMMVEFEHILSTITVDPSVMIGSINLIETNRLLEQLARWNNTQADYPRDTPLDQLIEQTSATYATKPALIFNGSTLSYRQLNETANQLAHYLLASGVRQGDIIGVAVDRSPDMLIALLAILRAGAAYLPLDPTYPQDRISFMVADSGAKRVLVSRNYQGRLRGQTTELVMEDTALAIAGYPTTAPALTHSGDSLAYVLYTSGSTGKPKGVLIEHRNLVNLLWSMAQAPGISDNDTLLAVTTISFDIAGLELFLPLLVGATVYLTDTATAKDGRALLALVKSAQISVMQATPSTWRMMLDSDWTDRLPLKALCGGEALPKDLATHLLTRCDELWNVYGPTETTIWSTVKRIVSADDITIGRPINNTQVYILDAFLKPVAEGLAGEIYIAGDGVARGYLNRQELTNERFVTNPFTGGAPGTMYRTGDLGEFRADGDIHCLGRVDHQVKIRGHRIELLEIEAVLAALEGIKEAVVTAHDDRQGHPQLVAYVVPLHLASQEQILVWKQQMQQHLPDYMIPVHFVAVKHIPLTPNGKVDRKSLPAPLVGEPGTRTDYVGPRTDVEQRVAAIWLDCLKLDKLDVFDNFFELGGHSLVAVQVMNRLEKETGKRLPLSTLFEYPTVEKLALALQMDGTSVVWDALVPIKPQGTKMPLYIVHGAGLHVLLFNTLAMHMDPDQPVYGLQAKGINSADKPHDSIEEMATYYIDAIMAKNPDGPYALAGFSFGGVIAYEMSRQLTAQGKVVKMLAMFDTYVYEARQYDSWLRKMSGNMLVSLKTRFYVLTQLKDDPQHTLLVKTESLKRKISQLYRRVKYDEDHLKVFLGNYYDVYQKSQAAYTKYVLVPHQVRIDLFRAKERIFYMHDFEFLGWKPFALKGVTVHEVPGNHNSLFDPPNDKSFARTLQNVLDKA